MVFVEDGTLPKVVHESFWSAKNEAIRLSRINPEKDVLLLEWHRRYRKGVRHESPVEIVKASPDMLKKYKSNRQKGE